MPNMEQAMTILEGYTDLEKGAYLGAIASLATADRTASEEELAQLQALSEAAGLSSRQQEFVTRAATEMTGDDLKKCLDVLRTSELRFALVADLLAFAKSDGNLTAEEEAKIKEMSSYLGIEQKQFSLLDEFQEKAKESGAAPEEMSSPSFLSSLGLGDRMKSAGINTSGLLQGLIAVAGPLILSRMLSGRNRNYGGMGGLGGGGGLGSLIGMLSGGRGMGSTGGLLSRIFGGGF